MNVHKIHTCTGHNAAIYALCAGPESRRWFSGGGDGWIAEWSLDDPETGRLAASVESQVFTLAYLPETHMLVAGTMAGGVHWINLSRPEHSRNIQHNTKGIYAVLPVAEWLFTAGADGVLTRWDSRSGQSMESLHLSSRALRCLAFNAGRRELAIGASDGRIYLLDADTLAVTSVWENAHQPSVFCLDYHPDGRTLFSGGRDAMLRRWDLASGTETGAWPAHWYTVNHLVFSPDGKRLATASRDRTVKIWDAGTVELLKVVDTLRYGGHVNSVNRLLWLDDTLISCSDDRTMGLWGISLED